MQPAASMPCTATPCPLATTFRTHTETMAAQAPSASGHWQHAQGVSQPCCICRTTAASHKTASADMHVLSALTGPGEPAHADLPRPPNVSQYMPSTCVESAPARCSLRCLRACSSAGLSPNVRFIQVATRTATKGVQPVSAQLGDAREGPGPASAARTFHRAYLGHERADVARRQPVAQALAPHQRVLVDDAVHPALAQH